MSYEVGTYVDLRHLNKKTGAMPTASKKSNLQEAASELVEVGTQIVFNFNKQGAKMARRIPIIYA
jgi:hypothetical protein